MRGDCHCHGIFEPRLAAGSTVDCPLPAGASRRRYPGSFGKNDDGGLVASIGRYAKGKNMTAVPTSLARFQVPVVAGPGEAGVPIERDMESGARPFALPVGKGAGWPTFWREWDLQ